MKRLIILLDGGHMRAQARRDARDYHIDFIEDFAHLLVEDDEELLRVIYYDCKPFQGEAQLPVSGETYQFKSGGGWLDELAGRDYFQVRTGTLKFRGWKPKGQNVGPSVSDADFRPDFEQKGIDIMIGLDMARIAQDRSAERLLLVSADTDLIPAMMLVRQTATQLIGVDFPQSPLHGEVLNQFDLVRDAKWPA